MSIKFDNKSDKLNGMIKKVSSSPEFKDIIENITNSLHDLDKDTDNDGEEYCFEEILGMF